MSRGLGDVYKRQMLFTLKSEEKVFVGDILEVKKPYISERGKKDFSYVIDRWIKALIDNHMIGQENNCAISRIELCALDVEEAWKEAKRTWIGKELSPAGYFAIVSSENMTHGKQLSYIKAEMHQKNCSAVTNLILEIKACEYIVMKHCH